MSENINKLNTLYQLMSKTYLLNVVEVKEMMNCIADIVGLEVKKLDRDEMTASLYRLGPYTMIISYRLEESFGLLNNSVHGVGLKASPELLGHIYRGRAVAFWDIRVFYGNYRVSSCSYLHITNLGYTLVDGKTKALTSLEKVAKLDTLKKSLKRIEEDADKRFSVYEVPSGFSTLVFLHYMTVANLYMSIEWRMQNDILRLQLRFIKKQNPEKAVLEILVHNYDSTDNAYQMYVKILGKDYKLKDRVVERFLNSDREKDRFIDGFDKTLKNRLIKRLEEQPEDALRLAMSLL